jgi:hypothetical protein
MRIKLGFGICITSLVFWAACSADKGSVLTDDGGTNTGGSVANGGAGGDGGASSAGGDNSGGFNPTGTGGNGTGGNNCTSGPDDDADMDGFTPNTGDCNDCDANVNPNAIEVILDPNMGAGGGGGGMLEPADENCDGNIDEAPMACDNVAVNSNNALDAARAVDICKDSTGPNDWGVVSAQWINSDGGPAPTSPNFHIGHGNLPSFGPNVNPQNGAVMLALSSGTARTPGHPEYQSVGGFSKGYQSPHPTGFPKESPACPGVTTGTPNDVAAVELTIRAPSNAFGFSFDFDFYTYEWPAYVCSQFNDFFVAELIPYPMGQTDGNISFDQLGNPVSVNNAFLEVCGCAAGPPCTAGGKTFTCALGDTELMGTGFGPDTEFSHHAATSWLATQAPINPGEEFQVRWMTYDSGDGSLDSTTLIDNFQWIAEAGTTVGTEPIPNPK